MSTWRSCCSAAFWSHGCASTMYQVLEFRLQPFPKRYEWVGVTGHKVRILLYSLESHCEIKTLNTIYGGKKSEFLTLTTIRTVMYKWSVTVRKCNKGNNTILHTCRGKLCAGTGKKRAGLWLRRQSWKPAPSAGQCRNYQWYFPTRSHLWRL